MASFSFLKSWFGNKNDFKTRDDSWIWNTNFSRT